MPDYEKLYHLTFNAITDAERLVDRAYFLLEESKPLDVGIAAIILKEVRRNLVLTQQECEEIYICCE